ncbi:MAG: type II secretion system F family protein [Bdellovibrionales bacterium]|nr:type II secretion system F family protein [Bdellovibrionales bacterium]
MNQIINILFSDAFVRGMIYFLAFASVFVFVLVLFPDEQQIAARKRLGVEDETVKPNKTPLLKWFYPIYYACVPLLYSSLFPQWAAAYVEKKRPQYQKDLIRANLRNEINPDEFFSFKVVMTLFSPVFLFYIFGAIGSSMSPSTWIFSIIGGFFFPDLWLKERIRLRRKAIIRVLPFTLDLLTLSVEAGLDFVASIQRMAQRMEQNALIEEFQHLLKEIRLGTSRSDALRSLADRLQIEEISSFSSLLIQADQLGASIGDVLRAQADQLRTRRFQNAESAGARASQLVLVPMVVCIFPAIFIVVLGPTLLNFLAQGIF